MRITTLTLDTIDETATGAVEYHFTPARPLHHRAGQAALVRIPGAGVKPFTISSGADSASVSIATTLASRSPFKQALAALTPGSRVSIAGGFGSQPATIHGHRVLVAQGIGITPFLSMARTETTLDATLLHVGTAHFLDEMSTSGTTARHHSHRDELTADVASTLTAHPDAHWSISGRGDFVRAVTAQLRTAGIARRRIHGAAFIGMRPAGVASSTTRTAVTV